MKRQISKTKKQYQVYLNGSFEKTNVLQRYDQPIFYSTVYLTPLTSKVESFQVSVPLSHFEGYSKKNLMLNYRVRSIDEDKRVIHCQLSEIEAYNTVTQGSKVSFNISVEIKNKPYFIDLKVLLNKKVDNARCSAPIQKIIRSVVQRLINDKIARGYTIEDLFLQIVNRTMTTELVDLINLDHARLPGFIKTVVISRIKTIDE